MENLVHFCGEINGRGRKEQIIQHATQRLRCFGL